MEAGSTTENLKQKKGGLMSFYKSHIRPRLFAMDAEKAHDRVSKYLELFGKIPLLPSLLRNQLVVDDPRLRQVLWGRTFTNPIGLAAGMDKTGRALLGWQSLGFGFLETGGFTKMAQPGNPKSRMFRIPEAHALINRMGFNNPGAEAAAETLAKIRPGLEVPLFANIGKGKDTKLEDAAKEYADVLECLFEYCDGFVANVSSPNTLGLRDLQQTAFLTNIIKAMRYRVRQDRLEPGEHPKPILIKVSPDLSMKELDEVLEVIAAHQVDGVIASNTSVSREGREYFKGAEEKGGWSGPHLFPGVLQFVKYIRKKLPSLPIIAVGGIQHGLNVFELIQAGANLVQVYSALVYEGPLLVRHSNLELREFMRNQEADFRRWSPKVKRE